MAYRVGFVGLGTMGRPMARHILDAQHRAGGALTIHGRDRSRLEDVITEGASWAETPRALASVSDVVIFMVPTLPDMQRILEGEDGLLAGLDHPITLVVSLTCAPQGVRELQAALDAQPVGVRVVDAPVSGGAEGAETGTLAILVGGDSDHVGPVIEILSAAGRPVHLGPLGAGQVGKACNQLIVAAEIVALAEASLLAERAGLDVARLFEVMQRGYAASRVMEVKWRRFAMHDYSPSGAAKHWVKDLAAIAEEAERWDLQMVTIDGLRRLFDDVIAADLGDFDTSVVQGYLDARSPRR